MDILPQRHFATGQIATRYLGVGYGKVWGIFEKLNKGVYFGQIPLFFHVFPGSQQIYIHFE